MKAKGKTLVLATILVIFPTLAMAMDMNHDSMQKSTMTMDHGDMQQAATKHDSMPTMDHGGMNGMQMDADTVMLQTVTVDGVKGYAHLKDISKAMSKMGMKQTHHFMVMFSGTDGQTVASGIAAIKVTSPNGTTAKTAKLMGMKGGFGSDITLADPGSYTFEVGTKLNDGKKRKFVFHHTLK